MTSRTCLLSLVLARTIDASRGDCLKLVGQGITHVDLLPEHSCGFRKLFLSCNRIAKLKNIVQFGRAEMISLAGNQIADFSQVVHLRRCPKLRTLNLSENPVNHLPFYRSHCLQLLPELTSLDSLKVTAQEREMVARTLQREAESLSLMLANFCLILKLKETCRRVR